MKHKMIILAAIILGSFITTMNVLAADRYEDYEMADGNTIRFIITPEGMMVEDARKELPKAVKPENERTPRKWVRTFELPESGRTIEFPLSEQETKAARKDAEQLAAREEAIRIAAAKRNAGVEATVIEMADGNSIVFKRDKEKNSNDIGSWLTNLFKGNDS